jgi:hypothetical protein
VPSTGSAPAQMDPAGTASLDSGEEFPILDQCSLLRTGASRKGPLREHGQGHGRFRPQRQDRSAAPAMGSPSTGLTKQRSHAVRNQIRAIVLGTLTVVAVGSFAASAPAEPGPFWHHRNVGEPGKGLKIDQPKDEQFQGKGGRQILSSEIGTTHIEIESPLVQIKGRIYNTALQGQIKVQIKYHFPKLINPELKGCEAKIGTNNEVEALGHLAWKWNGEKKQLEEQPQKEQKPDIIFTAAEIAEGATELPKATFTTITLKGTPCGVLAGTFNVTGSIGALIEPTQLETWSTQLKVRTPGWKQQHFWNGKEFIGATPSLLFGKAAASLEGEFEAHADEQEIAIFEK